VSDAFLHTNEICILPILFSIIALVECLRSHFLLSQVMNQPGEMRQGDCVCCPMRMSFRVTHSPTPRRMSYSKSARTTFSCELAENTARRRRKEDEEEEAVIGAEIESQAKKRCTQVVSSFVTIHLIASVYSATVRGLFEEWRVARILVCHCCTAQETTSYGEY
jgi:hypothetical protein